jgi:hypothetical protein
MSPTDAWRAGRVRQPLSAAKVGTEGADIPAVPSRPLPGYHRRARPARSVSPSHATRALAWTAQASRRRADGGRSGAPPSECGQSVPGSWGGRYHTDVRPETRQATAKCPHAARAGCAARAAAQWHRSHDTRTRPGPHSCPLMHRAGEHHQAGRCTLTTLLEHLYDPGQRGCPLTPPSGRPARTARSPAPHTAPAGPQPTRRGGPRSMAGGMISPSTSLSQNTSAGGICSVDQCRVSSQCVGIRIRRPGSNNRPT